MRDGRPYNDADRLIIMQMRDLARMGWTDIADALGRKSAGGVKSRYERWKRLEARAAMRFPAQSRIRSRNCLRCRRTFHSPHFGVRMCDQCRERVNNTSPYAPEPV